jgi:hypothetical protein
MDFFFNVGMLVCGVLQGPVRSAKYYGLQVAMTWYLSKRPMPVSWASLINSQRVWYFVYFQGILSHVKRPGRMQTLKRMCETYNNIAI